MMAMGAPVVQTEAVSEHAIREIYKELLGALYVTKMARLFESQLKVINIGLEIFKDALEAQGVPVVQVAWEKPVRLEKEYEDILSKIL